MEEKEIQETLSAAERIQTINRYRLLSVALIDAGMRYRETYWREDLADMQKAVPQPLKRRTKKETDALTREHKWRFKEVIRKEELKHNAFNRIVYDMIERVAVAGERVDQARYDNLVAILGEITRRMFSTVNPVELIAIIDMYHAGHFNSMLEEMRKIRAAEKEEVSVEGEKTEG